MKDEIKLNSMRVAVCGKLDTACDALRSEGVDMIDSYSDATELAFRLRQGIKYHLILVYAPQGEGLIDTTYPYKAHFGDEWLSVPIRLLNEPACHSAILELISTAYDIAKEQCVG